MEIWNTLFCDPPRSFRWARPVQVAARTVHVAAMGLFLGGVAYGAPEPRLLVPFLVTVVSGCVLLGIDLYRSCRYLFQGAGVAFVIKMALIGLGRELPSARIELYLAATVVASIGSHMTKRWRHHTLFGPAFCTATDENLEP